MLVEPLLNMPDKNLKKRQSGGTSHKPENYTNKPRIKKASGTTLNKPIRNELNAKPVAHTPTKNGRPMAAVQIHINITFSV